MVRVQKAAESTRLSMKARSLPSCIMDLCGVFIKDQFSFIVTGNESAAIILQVVVVPSIFSLA